MLKIITYLKNFIKITLPTFIIIFLIFELLVFRLIIPASKIPVRVYDEDAKMMNFKPNDEGYSTVGTLASPRFHWQTNNYGWVSPYDYQLEKKDKTRVAVIGDSYIEALQVNVGESYPFLLNDSMKQDDYEFYSFGISGAPFSQYLHMSRDISAKFNPDILIFNIVSNDITESVEGIEVKKKYFHHLKNTNGQVTEVLPKKDDGDKRKNLLKKSALVRYLAFNANINFGSPKKEASVDTRMDFLNENLKKLKSSIGYILNKIKEENSGRKILYVVDGDRRNIETLKDPFQKLVLEDVVLDLLKEKNLEYIDLQQVFKEDFQKNGVAFNSEKDYHWDAYGHEVVSKAIKHYIENSFNEKLDNELISN